MSADELTSPPPPPTTNTRPPLFTDVSENQSHFIPVRHPSGYMLHMEQMSAPAGFGYEHEELITHGLFDEPPSSIRDDVKGYLSSVVQRELRLWEQLSSDKLDRWDHLDADVQARLRRWAAVRPTPTEVTETTVVLKSDTAPKCEVSPYLHDTMITGYDSGLGAGFIAPDKKPPSSTTRRERGHDFALLGEIEWPDRLYVPQPDLNHLSLETPSAALYAERFTRFGAQSSFVEPGVKIVYRRGDLLDAQEDFLCHQCNCTTTYSAGLAKQMFERFTVANTYRHNPRPHLLGSVEIWAPVINMFAQLEPGPSKSLTESHSRLTQFKACLAQLVKLTRPGSTFAFPMRIGCGLAGGQWSLYERALTNFALHSHVKLVVLYEK